MKKYYFHDGNTQLGPFDIEELKSKGIKRETPIWFESLADWTPADEIPELFPILSSTPPPFKNTTQTLLSIDPKVTSPSKNNNFNKKTLLKIFLSIATIIILIATYFLFPQKENTDHEAPNFNTESQSTTNTIESGISNPSEHTTIDPKSIATRKFDEYAPKIEATKGAAISFSTAFVGDINNDGLEDAIIYFILTPKEGGNMLVGEGIAAYINKGNDMKVVAGFEPDYIFKVVEITNNKIHIIKQEYAENDLQGNPSIEIHKYLILVGNKLQESTTF